MLSNVELFTMSEHYRLPLHDIYLRDQCPSKIKQGLYIYNLDDSKQDIPYGTHWTCSIGDAKELIYFDSFGSPPPIEVDKFIKSKYKTYGWNNWIVQNIKSDFCGFFCIGLFLYVQLHRQKFHSLMECANEFMNLFGDDTTKSDKIIQSFFRKIKPICPIVKSKLLKIK